MSVDTRCRVPTTQVGRRARFHVVCLYDYFPVWKKTQKQVGTPASEKFRYNSDSRVMGGMVGGGGIVGEIDAHPVEPR